MLFWVKACQQHFQERADVVIEAPGHAPLLCDALIGVTVKLLKCILPVHPADFLQVPSMLLHDNTSITTTGFQTKGDISAQGSWPDLAEAQDVEPERGAMRSNGKNGKSSHHYASLFQ